METINATGQLHDAIVEEFSAMVTNATILWDGLYTNGGSASAARLACIL